MTNMFKMISPEDLNTRTISLLQNKWSKVESHFYIQTNKSERRVVAKSLLGVSSLGIRKGDDINFIIDHEDEIKLERDKNIIIQGVREVFGGE